MPELRLVIFDVDGTLVDSQGLIVASMNAAFSAVGFEAPSRKDILGIVGLSLEHALERLAPSGADHAAMLAAYRAHYFESRSRDGTPATSPLFPKVREVLDRLAADPWTMLAVATGKSKRGLDALIEGHGLEGVFSSLQCADFHPSKPHPSMIEAALGEAGVDKSRTVMVGDTSFDIDMARSAGVKSIAVSWGYHDASQLGADAVIDGFEALPQTIERLLEK